MAKSKKDIYLNFPLQILSDDFEIGELCKLAIMYGIMERMKHEGLEGVEGYTKVCKSVGFNVPLPKEGFEKSSSLFEELNVRFTEKFGKIVWVSVKKSQLLDFMNNSYSDLDSAVFRAFIAVKSFLGKKRCIVIDNKRLVRGMCGIGKKEHLYKNTLTDLYNKYSKDTPLKHLKKGLKRWRLEIYGGDTVTKMRGFYVSFTWNEETLINYAKEQKKAQKDRKVNAELKTKTIIDNANNRLYGIGKPLTTTEKLDRDVPF